MLRIIKTRACCVERHLGLSVDHRGILGPGGGDVGTSYGCQRVAYVALVAAIESFSNYTGIIVSTLKTVPTILFSIPQIRDTTIMHTAPNALPKGIELEKTLLIFRG
jgi:hypothetical protein